MDVIFSKRIAEGALLRRKDEITTAVFGFFLNELSETELCARLQRIRSEEKARAIAEDAAVEAVKIGTEIQN